MIIPFGPACGCQEKETHKSCKKRVFDRHRRVALINARFAPPFSAQQSAGRRTSRRDACLGVNLILGRPTGRPIARVPTSIPRMSGVLTHGRRWCHGVANVSAASLGGAWPGDRHALHGVLLPLDQSLRPLFFPGMKETFGNKKMKKAKKRPLPSVFHHARACDMCTS